MWTRRGDPSKLRLYGLETQGDPNVLLRPGQAGQLACRVAMERGPLLPRQRNRKGWLGSKLPSRSEVRAVKGKP